MAFREQQYLDRNFDYICRMLDLLGQNVLEPNYRPNWRTAYITSIVVIVMSELVYLLWTERSDLFAFLQVLPTLLFSCIGVQNVLVCALRSEKVLALRTKLTEILKIMAETEGNGPILCKGLQLSRLLQKCLMVLYALAAVAGIIVPLIIWAAWGKKILLFTPFVPKADPSTAVGFVETLVFQGYILLGAGTMYTAHECMFIAFIMPYAAYVNAFCNEIKELNSMLVALPESDDSKIQNQLHRIEKLHQLLIEYVSMLQDLYNSYMLSKVALIYLGVISAILVILTFADPMSCIFLALLFEKLTKSCLMGTIITVKVGLFPWILTSNLNINVNCVLFQNEQIMDHVYDINWFRLSADQAKQVGFMLHMSQNPTSITIGNLAPLNVESYMSLVKSIYSYVMVLITFLE